MIVSARTSFARSSTTSFKSARGTIGAVDVELALMT